MKEKLSKILSKESLEFDDEWLILSYSIMSDEILSFAYKKYKSGQLKTKHFGQYFRPLIRWLMKYFSNYESAPKNTIKDVFTSYSKSLRKEDRDILEEYLDRLAEEYISFQDSGVNPDFIKKEIIPKFIKKQETELLIQNLQEKLKQNNFEEIDSTIQNYAPLTDEDEDPDLGTIKPGSIRSIKKYYGEEKDQGSLFKMPGVIGHFIGPIYRGKLTAITGVEKRGKTHFMQEIGYHGVIHHKLKVLDINLEMPIEDKEERFWQRIGNFTLEKENAGKHYSPIFDCENNQFGTCEIRQHKLNKKDLLSSIDDLVYYEERRNWKICQKCRGVIQRSNTKNTKRFIPAIWFKPIMIKELNEKRISRTITRMLPYNISNYRMKCFPRFSATLDDVISYIKNYSYRKNFKPDIILIDYPDIMQPIEGNLMDRFNIDYNFKKSAGLSQELDAAIFVADQAVKAARNKRSLDVMDTSESKTKDAHIDMRLTLNQTDLERLLGLQRVGMLFRRKGKLTNQEVMLTQRLETGNVILDSEWWYNFNTHYPVAPKRQE